MALHLHAVLVSTLMSQPGWRPAIHASAEFAIVPGASHGLLVERPELCNTLILEFLTSD